MNAATLEDLADRLAELLAPRLADALHAARKPVVPRKVVEHLVAVHRALGERQYVISDLKPLRLVEGLDTGRLGKCMGKMADSRLRVDSDLRVVRVSPRSGNRGIVWKLVRGDDERLSPQPAAGIIDVLKLWGQR